MNPYVTMKYKKKVRLLVTNKCSRNCAYCHNEGMQKQTYQHLKPELLERFLPDIKKYTNKIVLSGGEPFEYAYLQELVDRLISYGFDLTLITANLKKEKMLEIGYGIKNVHYSIHRIDDVQAVRGAVQWLNQVFPNIRITLNVPFSEVDEIKENWDDLYGLALEVGANIQLIRIFLVEDTSHTTWLERWREMASYLEPFAKFLEATERETRFITKDLIKIDLLDIPCQSTGVDFSDGICLNNSDITIDPSLSLSICRWTSSSVALYQKDDPIPFDWAVKEATIRSCQCCRHGKIHHYLQSETLNYYLNAPHYTWPKLDDAIQSVYAKTFTNDISYFGRSGSILRLENEFSKFVGVDYALSVASGTVAVYLACLSLELSCDDEILIPVATYPTVAAAVLSASVKVRLCDIDPITGNISLESLREHITPNVKAVIVTHLWGLPVDMESVRRICEKSNIVLIEDCSHAYGATIGNRKVGSFGDIACFSLQANKAVYAGEGGMLLTSTREYYERVVTLSSSVDRILDCVKDISYLKYWGTGLGLKLKMNPLGAPLALHALSNLEKVNEQKRIRAACMEKKALASEVFLVAENHVEQCQRTYYTFKLTLKDQYIAYRDSILRMLIANGLEANVSSFIPFHQHELSANANVVNADEQFSGSEKYFSRIISLPAFVYEPVSLAEYYGDSIGKVSDIMEKTGLSIVRDR